MNQLLFFLSEIIYLISGINTNIVDILPTHFKINDCNKNVWVVDKYTYFDLFTMQPGEPCDNDSCVYVIEKGDSLIVETKLPRSYSVALKNHGDYWHSAKEFNMDNPNRDRYNITLSKLPPTRFDRFFFKDKILEYEQTLYMDSVAIHIYFKQKDNCEYVWLKSEAELETNPDKILEKIRNFQNKRIDTTQFVKKGIKYLEDCIIKWNNLSIDYVCKSKYIHNGQIKETDFKHNYTRTYPELQIWGGICGMYRDRDENMDISINM